METWIYVLVAKNFFTTNGIEYARTIDSQNITLTATLGEAIDMVTYAQTELFEKGYHVINSDTPDNEFGPVYWCRMGNGDSRAVVLEILRKVVKGSPFQIDRS